MKPIKRLEIVIDAAHTPELVRALKNAGEPGYTLIRDVQGDGDRGERSGDELTNVFRNCMVVVACEHDAWETVLEGIRPLLDQYGGMCLASDAHWLMH